MIRPKEKQVIARLKILLHPRGEAARLHAAGEVLNDLWLRAGKSANLPMQLHLAGRPYSSRDDLRGSSVQQTSPTLGSSNSTSWPKPPGGLAGDFSESSKKDCPSTSFSRVCGRRGCVPACGRGHGRQRRRWSECVSWENCHEPNKTVTDGPS